ncbi:MAG: MMPL family transporter [Deltaproteobacteria bacterium]|nr:MMPL family transporter [Deltaproteobacteria bacterium]
MREKLFARLAQLISTRPWWVLGACVLLLAVSIGIVEVRGLKMETRILDLLPKEDPAALAYEDILKQYDSASQIIIGVEGGSRTDKIGFIDKVAPLLRHVVYTDRETGKTHRYVKHSVTKLDTDYMTAHGLMLTTRPNLEKIETLFSGLEMADLLSAYNDFLEMEYIEDTSAVTEREKEDGAISNLKGIMLWLDGVTQATEGERATHASRAVDAMTIGDQYLFSQDDGMLIAMVVPTISIDKMEETLSGVESLRAEVQKVQRDYPQLSVRMTGMPVLSLEEMEVTEKDMGAGTLVSLALILALFVLAFRMWTAPLLAIVNLLVGIAWTLPVIALAFGRLNLMTAMFAIILIGLGIDFAIHLNAAYATARAQNSDVGECIRQMFSQAGNGVVTGAMTTAVAFAVLIFTGLDAFIELGVVLASGIVLTLIASMTVLPAMYVVTERARRRLFKKTGATGAAVLPIPLLEKSGALMLRPFLAITVIAVTVAATVFLGMTAKRATFESNMLEIEPADMPSVLLHREVLDKFEINPDFAMMSVATVDEARQITLRMKKNRLVGRVDSVSEYLPSSAQQKRRAPVIKAIARNAEHYLPTGVTSGLPIGGAIASFPRYMLAEETGREAQQRIIEELNRLNMNVVEIGQMGFISMKNRLAALCTTLSGGRDQRFSKILALKKAIEKDEKLGRKIALWQRAYIPRLAERLQDMASLTPLSMETLPGHIRDRYVSDAGRNLVTIYAAVDLWDGNRMALFNQATGHLSGHVTGTVVLMDRLMTLVGSRGKVATLLALGAVFIILLIDFRHIGYALVGMLPLLFGFVWMVGIFTLMGHKFDAANVMGIPLILGIGIDDAVHLLHGIRREGIARLPLILKHTGRALVLTSLTTAIAFGSIAGASHRGLAGMGLLLTLGVASCLLMSILLLPAVAALVFPRHKNKDALDAERSITAQTAQTESEVNK